MPNGRADALLPKHLARVADLIDRFEEAWLTDAPLAIDELVSLVEPADRLPLLVELVHIDLERRLTSRQDTIRVESYFSQFPELAENSIAALELIAAEFLLRRQQEPHLSSAEFTERFPQWREDLGKVLGVVSRNSRAATRVAKPNGGGEPGASVISPSADTATRPASDTWAPAPFISPPTGGSHLPRSFGDYDLLAEIARGGMGVVYQARQKGLNRIVALKMILAGQLAGEEAVRRFRAEAESAARLRHPGVVAVYEVGERDGQHFFSMEYVAGQSLAALAREKPFSAEAAARMLQSIAVAIHYAHEHGVLHRDLKPANVLIDTDGRPRVTDFGLAKRMDAPPGDTQTHDVMGTPSYMPPEQAAGRIRELGPRSDVYSLGAMLYELLTGRPPFRADTPLETLREVLDREPVSPRLLNSKTPRDLVTICLKCLEKDSSRRYESAQSLADELGRFLRGEPIHARPIGRISRAARWCRRKPVAATAVVLAAIVIGLFAIGGPVIAVREARHSTDLKRETKEANDQKLIAQDNEQFAREQSQFALQTLNTVVYDLQRDLRKVPGTRVAQRRVLATALARLELLSSKYLERTAVDYTSMVTLGEIADVILRIGPGPDEEDVARAAPGMDSARRLRGPIPNAQPSAETQTTLVVAQRLLRRASDIALELSKAQPGDSQVQARLALSYQKLGEVKKALGETRDALALFQKSAKTNELRAIAEPGSPEVQLDLALSYQSLGRVTLQLGQTREALAYVEKFLGISENRVTADPGDSQAQRLMALSYQSLGDIKFQLGQTREALELYQKSLDIREKRAAAEPADDYAQRDLADSHQLLGHAKLRLGQIREAQALYQKVLEYSEGRISAEPGDSVAQRNLAAAYHSLGDLKGRLGQTSEALALFQKALEHSARRAAAEPDDAFAQRVLVVSYWSLGDVKLRLLQTHEALSLFQKSLEVCKKRAAAEPNDAEAQLDLAATYDRLGNATMQLGQAREARENFQKSREICERQAAADPGDSHAQRALAGSYQGLGDVALQLRQTPEALALFQKSLEVREKRAAAEPDDIETQRDLALAYDKLANVKERLGHTREALALYQKSREIFERQAATDPGYFQAQRDLAAAYLRVGDVTRKLGQAREAQTLYQNSLAMREQQAAARPEDADAQLDLASSLERLGDVMLQLGQASEALTLFRKSLAIREQRAAAEPGDAEAQRNVKLSYGLLGDAMRKLGQTREALPLFQKLLELSEQRAAAAPGDFQARFDLAVSHLRLGEVTLQHGQTREALSIFQKSMEVAQKLAAAEPGNSQTQILLAELFQKLSLVSLPLGQTREAHAYCQQALAIVEKRAADLPDNLDAQQDLAKCYILFGDIALARFQFHTALASYDQGLATLDGFMMRTGLQPFGDGMQRLRDVRTMCELAERAITDLSLAAKQDKSVAPQLLLTRVQALLFYAAATPEEIPAAVKDKWSTGHLPTELLREAELTAETLRRFEPTTLENLYNAGCCFALCLKGLARLDVPDKDRQMSELQTKALAALNAAHAAGFKDADMIAKDTDLDPLRDLPEFKQFLELLRSEMK